MKCHVTSFEAKEIGLQKKGPIWECFFAFTMCQENTYISRLLAIMIIIRLSQLILLVILKLRKFKLSIFITCNAIQKVLCPKVFALKKNGSM